MQEIEIWPKEQMVYAQPRICSEEWDAQNSQGFWDINGWPNLAKKKIPWRIVYFAVLTDHRVKLKETEERDKYLDFVRELKKTMEHESDGDTDCN